MGDSDAGRATPAAGTGAARTTGSGTTATDDARVELVVGAPAGGGAAPRRGGPRWLPFAVIAGVVALLLAALMGLGVVGGSEDDGADPPRVRPTRAADPNHVPGTLFVSPEGSDAASGAEGAPLATLETALQRLQPGDTLVVGDGEYRESLRNLVITPGTAEKPIRVQAAPGAKPVLEGLLWLAGADYWDVSGLHVTWDRRNNDDDHMVKFTGGTGWTLRDGELSDARSYAALLISGGANRFTVSGMYIHDTKKANGRNQDHLIYVNTNAQGGVIERNVLAGSRNGRAVKVGPPSETDEELGNVVIRYNTMVDNRGPSNVSLSYNVTGVEVYRNIMVDPDDRTANVTAKDLTGSGNVVRDNLIFGSAGPDEPGTKGLEDTGGNVVADPQFVDPAAGDYRTRNPQAADYGRYAGETAAS